MTAFAAPIAEQIWDMKYRLKEADGAAVDQTVEDTWRRIARALASVEAEPAKWEDRFYNALEGFKYLPAGRIVAGAGTGRQVTLFNCFVMGTIPDSMAGIFEALKEAALTMQQGGGIGYDFSTIRPRGAAVHGVAADASGPLSFMDVWDAMCRTIMSAGSRRGAMMATMRCDHPDIEAFIAAKQDSARLRMFNLSVLVTDAFMRAVRDDASWDLQFDGRIWRSGDDKNWIARPPGVKSLCEEAMDGDGVFWVEDGRAHPDYRHHPRMTGPQQIRFIAAAPIRVGAGEAMGVICVGGPDARARDEVLCQRLEALAAMAADACLRQLEHRQALRAEAKATAANALSQALVHAAPVAICMTDTKMRMLRVSPRWLTERGLPGDMDVQGKSLYDLVPHTKNFAATYDRCLKGDVVTNDCVALTLKDGSQMWLRAEVTPWRRPTGRIGGLLIITVDITSIIAAHELTKRSEERLKIATRAAAGWIDLYRVFKPLVMALLIVFVLLRHLRSDATRHSRASGNPGGVSTPAPPGSPPARGRRTLPPRAGAESAG